MKPNLKCKNPCSRRRVSEWQLKSARFISIAAPVTEALYLVMLFLALISLACHLSLRLTILRLHIIQMIMNLLQAEWRPALDSLTIKIDYQSWLALDFTELLVPEQRMWWAQTVPFLISLSLESL